MSKRLFTLLGMLLLLNTLGLGQYSSFRAPLPLVKNIQLSTGVKLEYVEQGDAKGISVILLHGFTDSWHSWEPVLPLLPGNVHVLAVTLRGHGNSDKPATGYAMHNFSADIAAFLHQQKISNAIVVGHSMGSMIAQQFALDHPEMTKGLVLVGSFADFSNNAAVQEFAQSLEGLKDPIDREFAAGFQQSTLANPIQPAFLKTMIGESCKVPAHVWKKVGQSLFQVNYLAPLRSYTKPVKIIWGDKDVFSPRHDQELLTVALSGSTVLVYEGIGHAVHWESPSRFADDLITFINGF